MDFKDKSCKTVQRRMFQRIYEIPLFFYAIKYAMEHVLSICRTDISSYLPPKVKSQQITLSEYFKIAKWEHEDSKNGELKSLFLSLHSIIYGLHFGKGYYKYLLKIPQNIKNPDHL